MTVDSTQDTAQDTDDGGQPNLGLAVIEEMLE